MPSGSCLCGAVRIEVAGALGAVDACHCRECRRQTGHYLASANVPRSALSVAGEDKVGWYRSSEKVRRGFCTICGSVLFWDPLGHDWTSVAMGAFEAPTGAKLELHIFVEEKGDYYEIADGLPQNPR